DYFLVPAGMRITYDLSRRPFDPAGNPLRADNGRVVKIEQIPIDHSAMNGVYETGYTTIYDATDPNNPDPWFGTTNALRPVIVVANLYVATLSYIAGVKLKDPATGGLFAK